MKKCKWLLLIGVFLSYFISPYLPDAWGEENDFLEWLQVVILVLGMVLNYIWYQEAEYDNNISSKRFLAWTTPLWLLIIGRELSWGRVLYPSIFKVILVKNVIHLLLAIIIVVWLYVGKKYDLYKIPYKLLKERLFPITELIITAIALLVADLAEHRLHLPQMEEFNECISYLGLILVAYYVKTALKRKKSNIISRYTIHSTY